jgi:hypothetical protein
MKLKLLALVAGLAAAASASAQPPAPPPEAMAAVQKACAADAASLCAGKTDQQIPMCLFANTDKVSPGCKEAMSKLPPPGGPPPS